MAFEQDVEKRKKKTIILILLLLLLVIAVLVYLLLIYYKVESPINFNVNTNTPSGPQIVNLPEPGKFNQSDSNVLADVKALNGGGTNPNLAEQGQASLVAAAFVERFGSYSNQGNYDNFTELDMFMTDHIKKWVAEYKQEIKDQHADQNIYYAIETKVISKQILSLDEIKGLSQILLKTQRQEFNNSITDAKVFYQDISLNLVKVDQDWKVDGAFWQ